MSEIYIVKGNCGQYSDWTCWEVKAFTVKGDADALADELNKVAKTYKDSDEWEDRYDDMPGPLRKRLEELDPNFQTDYTGTSYGVSTVPLSGKY